MLSAISTVLLCVVAWSAAAPGEHDEGVRKNYQMAAFRFKLAVDDVKNNLPSTQDGEFSVLDPHVHYGLMAASVLNFVELLSSSCVILYEPTYYQAVANGVSAGWSDPAGVAANVTNKINFLTGLLAPALELVKDLCTPIGAPCDELVDAAVKDNPSLKGRVKLLVEVGHLSFFYLVGNYTGVANSHEVVKDLVEGVLVNKDLFIAALHVNRLANDLLLKDGPHHQCDESNSSHGGPVSSHATEVAPLQETDHPEA